MHEIVPLLTLYVETGLLLVHAATLLLLLQHRRQE